MRPMTEEFLKAAFAGESQAHMKYMAFAAKAEKEGKPNIANLFRAIAFAELVHAHNHLEVLGGIGSTAENLEAAKGGEDFEIDEMYPAYLENARLQGEKKAERSFNFAVEAEKIHSELYAAAKKAVDAGEDLSEAKVWVCPVCGWTFTGDEPPERCPVCQALAKVFKAFG
ncbi:MAG: rubrerythrin family protein [Acidobacteria bacterium]|nr:rubrerythrin family protein [Acidobacteriota bacterium]